MALGDEKLGCRLVEHARSIGANDASDDPAWNLGFLLLLPARPAHGTAPAGAHGPSCRVPAPIAPAPPPQASTPRRAAPFGEDCRRATARPAPQSGGAGASARHCATTAPWPAPSCRRAPPVPASPRELRPDQPAAHPCDRARSAEA